MARNTAKNRAITNLLSVVFFVVVVGRAHLLGTSQSDICTKTIILGLCPKLKNEWKKWKNPFSEMKEDVGMLCFPQEPSHCLLSPPSTSWNRRGLSP